MAGPGRRAVGPGSRVAAPQHLLQARELALVPERRCQTRAATTCALAPHERLPEILVVPRENTPTGAAARGKP